MAKCKKCGAELDKDALFCAVCGTKVEKSKVGIFVAIAVVVVAIIGAGAFGVYKYMHKDDEQEEMIEYASYVMSPQYLFDLKVLDRASELSRDMKLLYLDYLTNGFTTEVGKNTEEYFNENKEYYWKMMASIGIQMEEEGEMYQESLDRLMEHGILTSCMTVDENGKGHLTKFSEDNKDEEVAAMRSFRISDLIATPAYADEQITFGPFKSLYEFKQVPKKVSKDTRRKLITIAQQLSGEDLRELHKNLPSDYKNGENDYKKWWDKLANGDYDTKSYAIMQYLQYVNSAYHPNDAATTNFQNMADQLGVDSNKEFLKAAKKMVEAGANLKKDFEKTWLALMAGTTAPTTSSYSAYQSAMGKGLDIGSDVVTAYDQTDPSVMNRVEIFCRRAWDNAVQGKTINGIRVSVVSASDIIDGVKTAYEFVDDHIIGERDKPQIDWDKKKIPAIIKLKDEDTESPAFMAVVYNTFTHEIFYTNEKDENGNFVIKMYEPQTGALAVTLYDENGSKGSEYIWDKDKPKTGETLERTLITDEKQSLYDWDALTKARVAESKLIDKYNEDLERFKEEASSTSSRMLNLFSGSIDKMGKRLDEDGKRIDGTREWLDRIDSDIEKRMKAKKEAIAKEKAEKEARAKARAKAIEQKRAKEKAAAEAREKAEKEAMAKEKAAKAAKAKADSIAKAKAEAEEPKDPHQQELEKISGMDKKFFVGTWKASNLGVGKGVKMPPGLKIDVTVTYNSNGTWQGKVAPIKIPGGGGAVIPGQTTSGKYTFDGFNLKYSSGEVFVVTKVSDKKIIMRDINHGTTTTMTKIR